MIRLDACPKGLDDFWTVDAIPTRITPGAGLDRTSAHTGVGNLADSQRVYTCDLIAVGVRVAASALTGFVIEFAHGVDETPGRSRSLSRDAALQLLR